MKIDPYCQRRICCPHDSSFLQYKFYGDIRADSLERRRQTTASNRKRRFSVLSDAKANIIDLNTGAIPKFFTYHLVPCCLSTDVKYVILNDIEWLFYVNICFASVCL